MIGPDSYTVLTLTVSGGPDLITLEDYTGQSYLVIQPRLETTLGLKVEIVKEKNQTFGKDLIIRMEPAPGSQVSRGSTVRVIVSDGTGRVKLTADLLGLGKTQLEARFAAIDLVAGAYEVTPFAAAAIAEGTIKDTDLVSLSFNYPVDSDVPVKTSITTTFGTREELEGILNPTPTPDPSATTLPTETTAPTEPTAKPTKPTKETTAASTAPTTAVPTTAATAPSETTVADDD